MEDFGLTIVPYRKRHNLTDEDGTVLGSYDTYEQAVVAKQWWVDLGNKRLNEKVGQ